jgi:hypothetical protein
LDEIAEHNDRQMTMRSKSAAAAKLGNPDEGSVTDSVHVSNIVKEYY